MIAAFLCRRSATRLNWVLGISHLQAVARPLVCYSGKNSLFNINRFPVSWESPYRWLAITISNSHTLLYTESGKQPDDDKIVRQSEDETQFEDTGIRKVRYAYHMEFLSETSYKATPCYRILDDHGCQIAGTDLEEVGKEFALKMCSDMVIVQVMDIIFYEAQRQVRISFYLTSIGEEAVGVGSVAGLSIEDVVFA